MRNSTLQCSSWEIGENKGMKTEVYRTYALYYLISMATMKVV